MKRREFFVKAGLATGAMVAPTWGAAEPAAPAADTALRIGWKRTSRSRLFSSVTCDGNPLVTAENPGLLDGVCRLWSEAPALATRMRAEQPSATHGPLRCQLSHKLHDSGSGLREDLLEAVLTIGNTSDQPRQVEIAFTTSVQPSRAATQQQAYLPLNAAGLHGDKRFAALGVNEFLKDCDHGIGPGEFQCHYLEPMASYPNDRQTKALLLAPVVDIQQPSQPWHVALFTPSDEPVKFSSTISAHGDRVWRVGRVVTVPPGATHTQRCWLMLHTGDAAVPWKAFHRFAHDDPHPRIGWIRDFKVHYYDFLSSAAGKDGHRGDGYDAAVGHFRQFHVGLGTQHGYYPCMGDHLHPDRKNWLAMQGDQQGPVQMSLDTVKARIRATRAQGAKAGIYMHMSALDDSSRRFYPPLAEGRRIDSAGQPVRFGWNGPDVKGRLWWMSMSSPQWRAHLLQQAEWIMDVFQPDAICMDETFSGVGYDFRRGSPEPLSSYAIDFFKQLHALVRSFGPEKALFSSDCSMAGFSLWADGEVGDHAYPNLLGNPLYRQSPVRYLAALGDKPWRPCAWHFRHMWKQQMALARQVGSGVGVSNGWIEYSGLHGLPAAERERMIAGIESLL